MKAPSLSFFALSFLPCRSCLAASYPVATACRGDVLGLPSVKRHGGKERPADRMLGPVLAVNRQ
jgi:hypothetical protein